MDRKALINLGLPLRRPAGGISVEPLIEQNWARLCKQYARFSQEKQIPAKAQLRARRGFVLGVGEIHQPYELSVKLLPVNYLPAHSKVWIGTIRATNKRK